MIGEAQSVASPLDAGGPPGELDEAVPDGLGDGLAVSVGDGDRVGLGLGLAVGMPAGGVIGGHVDVLAADGLSTHEVGHGAGVRLPRLGEDDALGLADTDVPCLAETPGDAPSVPGAPPGGLCPVLGDSFEVCMMFWRRPGMARIMTIATSTAPAVASTGRSQPSFARSRSGTMDFTTGMAVLTAELADLIVLPADLSAGTAARRTAAAAVLAAGTTVIAADRAAGASAATAALTSAATGASTRMALSLPARAIGRIGGVADRRSAIRNLQSMTTDLSQPRSNAKLSRDCSCAILWRIRSRPSRDGTTPSAAACSARRKRSLYSASGSVMTPAPRPCGARTCRAPCDFSLLPC